MNVHYVVSLAGMLASRWLLTFFVVEIPFGLFNVPYGAVDLYLLARLQCCLFVLIPPNCLSPSLTRTHMHTSQYVGGAEGIRSSSYGYFQAA